VGASRKVCYGQNFKGLEVNKQFPSVGSIFKLLTFPWFFSASLRSPHPSVNSSAGEVQCFDICFAFGLAMASRAISVLLGEAGKFEQRLMIHLHREALWGNQQTEGAI
jgi:hypothetical protein